MMFAQITDSSFNNGLSALIAKKINSAVVKMQGVY
jgi:hypothetical protein